MCGNLPILSLASPDEEYSGRGKSENLILVNNSGPESFDKLICKMKHTMDLT